MVIVKDGANDYTKETIPRNTTPAETVRMWYTKFISIWLLVSVYIASSTAELIVTDPPGVAGTYVAYPLHYKYNFRNETIEGDMVLFNATDVVDKIVLVPYYRATYLTQIRTQQGRGAKAVIISVTPGFIPGQGSSVLDGTTQDDITLSAWQIGSDTYGKLSAFLATHPNITLSIIVNPDGINPWQHIYDTFMIFYQVFISLFCTANLALAIFRLVKHVQADGCRKTLPQSCLQLIIVGNIFRLLLNAVDPNFSRPIYPLPLKHLLWTFSYPFSLSVTILITFYWHDVMHGMSLNINQMLGKFKVPFFVIIGILFSVEIACGVTRALITVTGIPVQAMITTTTSFYSAVCFGFAIFFFVTAAKLIKVLSKKNMDQKSKRRNTLRRMTTRIVVIGGCLICHIVLFGIIADTANFFKPVSNSVLWFFSFLVLCIQDLFQILVLVPKTSKKSSSNHSSNKTRQTELSTATGTTMTV